MIGVYRMEKNSIYVETFYISSPVSLYYTRYMDDNSSLARNQEYAEQICRMIGEPQYIVKNSQPHSSQFFQRQTRTYNDNDRLKVKLTITPRINAFKNSFFVRSSHVWNSLPLEIRSQTNTDTFKKGLTSYFWRELEIT